MSVAEPQVELPRIPFATAEFSPEAIEAAGRILRSGWVTTGPEVAQFELEFAEAVDAAHAVAVSSCTAGIELSLRALDLPAGATVLTPSMTFCGAVHAIVHAGLRPVLIDIDTESLMPDARSTAEAARRAGGADAMVVLHFGGAPAPVAELAAAAGLPLERVVEDAAHALGTAVDDRAVGAVSSATSFSFYATKNLPIGEGGMVTTDRPETADYLRRARLHGMSGDAWKRYLPGSSWGYEVAIDGLKANMTDLSAAIGRAQLRELPAWQRRRAEIADRYDEGLRAVPWIRTPARPPRGRHAWHLYVIQLDPGVDRDRFIRRLSERGVDCSVHFIPVHHQPYFRRLLGIEPGDLPGTDAVFPHIVSLPMYPSLSDEAVDRVIGEAVTAA